MSSTAFSSDGQEALFHQIESTFPLAPSTSTGRKDLREYFEIERCVEFIQSDQNFQRVALQFPDFLLCDAAKVTSMLSNGTKASLFILGDTSYGSCCVDEVAAEHVQADCIIHFGPACLTQTRRLPVLYVFGRESVDVLHCVAAFKELYTDRETDILVLYNTAYFHSIDEFRSHIFSEYPNCVFSRLVLPERIHHGASSGENTVDVCKCCCGAQDMGCSKLLDKPTAGDNDALDSTLAAESTTRASLANQLQRRTDKTVGALEQKAEELCIEEDRSEKVGLKELPRDHQEAAKPQRHKYIRFGRTFELRKPIEEYQVFYVGYEGPNLTNLILNYNKCQFCSYNPITRESRRETINVNKALGRRYFLVQKAKEAKTVGILVGTLGAADYLVIIERLKKIMKQAGKKEMGFIDCVPRVHMSKLVGNVLELPHILVNDHYYTIAVGKLNVAKMANFMEIDIFVLVACPENSLVDSQEFYKPVVTPFEMEVACVRSREWSGDYVTDYQDLFPGGTFHVPVEEDIKTEREPEYSLISGGLLSSQQDHDEEKDTQTSAIVPRSKMEVALHSSAAAEYLQSRSWQGLEQRLGETEVTGAVEGTTGVAAAYTHELIEHRQPNNV